ncbi:MAG TPA: DUF2489 domain-containing protein [Thiopseudomonas sp.]|nr:DUF2489 domain-containing protein [Thiopseudomonas sp.]
MQILSSPWLIIAAACTIALAIYAGLLWRRVGQAEQQRKQLQAEQKRLRHDDLTILTTGFLSEQMPWAEGCIRIKVILDHYDSEMAMHPDYQVLQTVFSATKHIPTHDAWRELSSAEKQTFMQLLNELEQQHKHNSIQVVEKLLKHLQS